MVVRKGKLGSWNLSHAFYFLLENAAAVQTCYKAWPTRQCNKAEQREIQLDSNTNTTIHSIQIQIMIQISAQMLQPNMHVWQGCGWPGKAGRETSLSRAAASESLSTDSNLESPASESLSGKQLNFPFEE